MVETSDIDRLKALVQAQMARIKQFQAENADLRRRLGMNPVNAHKPPFSQGYAKKVVLPKPGGGKISGQVSHRGKTLEVIHIPDHPLRYQASHCPDCDQGFWKAGQVVATRQVFDLPQPRLEVTPHQLIEHVCLCGCLVRGQLPAQVTAPLQYGLCIHCLSTLLHVEYRLRFAKISQLWYQLTGYTYNESTLQTANQSLFERLPPFKEQVKTTLTAAPVTHHERRGILMGGKLHWLHVSCTALLTDLFVHPKRGRKALESAQSVFNHCTGWTVHDCWASYFVAGRGRHSLCSAYLVRELQALIEGGSSWAKLMQTYLLDLYQLTRHGPLRPTHHPFWRGEYVAICEAATREEPPPEPRPRQSKGRNSLDRLVDVQPAVLAFAFESGGGFTNTQAERDLRAVKVKQWVSNCFRTESGAVHYARIWSFMALATRLYHEKEQAGQLTATRRGP